MRQSERDRSIGYYLRKQVHLTRMDSAVSEVVGTLLLVSIGITLFTLLALVVFNIPYLAFSSQTPNVSIIGMVDDHNNVILVHCGGPSLPLDTKVTLSFAETKITVNAGDNLSASDKANGKWDIGERFVFHYMFGNIKNLLISTIVVDPVSKSVVLQGVVQEGSSLALPYAETLPATHVTTHSAYLNMRYDFRLHAMGIKQTNLYYWRAGWTEFRLVRSWENGEQSGTNYTFIDGLEDDTDYFFIASVKYNLSNSNVDVIINGTTLRFHTLTFNVGLWHFDEPSGLKVNDSSLYHNNGTMLPPYEELAPQRNLMPDAVKNRSLSFNGLNDYVRVNHSDSLNITENLTIETWLHPLKNSTTLEGIVQSLNKTQFGLQNYSSITPDIIHLNQSQKTYAIVSRGVDGRGYLITLNITETGEIIKNATTCIRDSYIFESQQNCFCPRIIYVAKSNDLYAIVYSKFDNAFGYYGFIITVHIANNGTITKPFLVKRQLLNWECYQPKIINISGNIYGIFYTQPKYNYAGWVSTVNITDSGIKVIYNFTYPDSYGEMKDYDIIHTSGQYFSIVYSGFDLTNALIRRVRISQDGLTIFSDQHDVRPINYNGGTFPRITHVHDDVYTVFYAGVMNPYGASIGILYTLRISQITGLVTQDVIDYEIIEPTSFFRYPSIFLRNQSNMNSSFLLFYIKGDSDATIKTVNISWSGEIYYDASNDSRKFTIAGQCTNPRIISVSPDANFYAVVDDQNTICTVEIAQNGSIIQHIVDSVNLYAPRFTYPDIIHIHGSVYAVVSVYDYASGSQFLFIKTLNISNEGGINNSFIDSFNSPFTAPFFVKSYIKIINVTESDHIYAIAFSDLINETVVIKTIRITDEGIIGQTFNDSFEYTSDKYCDVGTNWWCSADIIHVTNDIYAVSYHGVVHCDLQLADLVLTISIASDGRITFKHNFNTSHLVLPNDFYDQIQNIRIFPINTSTGIYGIIDSTEYLQQYPYNTYVGYGQIITVHIDQYGEIDFLGNYTFTSGRGGCTDPDIINIADNIFAISYTHHYYWYHNYTWFDNNAHQWIPLSYSYNSIGGQILTVWISPDGLQFRTIDPGSNIANSTSFSNILRYNNNVYALAYTNSGSQGMVGSFRIAPNGNISKSISGSPFDYVMDHAGIARCINPWCLPVYDNVYVMAYQNLWSGTIETFKITIPGGGTKTTFFSKVGVFNFTADFNDVNVTVRMTNGNQTLSLPLYNSWNYLVLTYNHLNGTIALYNIHGNPPHLDLNNITYTYIPMPSLPDIRTSTKNLFFGPYTGIYDEFAISSISMNRERIIQRYTTIP